MVRTVNLLTFANYARSAASAYNLVAYIGDNTSYVNTIDGYGRAFGMTLRCATDKASKCSAIRPIRPSGSSGVPATIKVHKIGISRVCSSTSPEEATR